MTRTCILSQGSEILSGSVQDTNAQWISEYLYGSQYLVYEHTTVTDNVEHLVQTLERLCTKYDVVISTGGLGPTTDDITRQAVSILTGQALSVHTKALAHIESYYAKRNRIVPSSTHVQTLFPDNSNCLLNPIGSACGIHTTYNETDLYFFPGVPREMMLMIPEVLPVNLGNPPLVFATFGVSESQLLLKLKEIELPPIAFHATRRGNWLTVLPSNESRSIIETTIKRILEPFIFNISTKKKSLVDVVSERLLDRSEMVATAESCTAGKLSSWFTSISGSSRYFKEGVIVYSNESKHKYCGVSMDLIERQGAVCQSVSIDLAKGIQKYSGATWGIGITGIAGPSGGSEEKPVGTVHITVYGNDQVHHKHCTFHGARDQITDQACGQAVFMLFNAMRSA